jgi:DNA (cytosine-5)-methyltransferase 1
MEGLIEAGRGPRLMILENVCGTLTSHDGKDFREICAALEPRYRVGAVVVDAVHFVPQSRPRLFIIGVRDDIAIPTELTLRAPSRLAIWHPRAVQHAYQKLPAKLKEKWVWWNLRAPGARNVAFSDVIEDEPTGVEWHTKAETAKLLKMMSGIHREKVDEARQAGQRMVGAVYKRTRRDEFGRKVQRAEIRFDDIAGCLRTPAGGSSRQVIVIVHGDSVRSRLISPRETARLMGLPEDYELPTNYNEAYHLTGDGVAVPVVRHLAQHIFERLLPREDTPTRVAA